MNNKILVNKITIAFLIIIFLNQSPVTSVGSSTIDKEYLLPAPGKTDIVVEDVICTRMSIREYTNESITDEDLSSILYAAYGIRSDGKHTVFGMNGINSGIIYVLKEDAAYKYNPKNHSLIYYKTGDWRNTVGWQYPGAPIVLGLCWDSTLADANFAGVELGEIGQNIAFMASSLDIGTVVTGEVPPAINKMGIPDNEQGMIVMPLGHPLHQYDFTYAPMWVSLLPKITKSTKSYSTALEERTEIYTFSGELSRMELSQLIWSSYGFSYNIDTSNQEKNSIVRHRTVPSAHGYYPLIMYTVTEDSICRYQPNILTNIFTVPVDFLGLPILTYLSPIAKGDLRRDISQSSSISNLDTAPLSIVIVLDLDMAKVLSAEQYYKFWYYEAGAAAFNVMLEATVLGFQSNIAYPSNQELISNILNLNDKQIPLLIVPVGE